MNNLFLKYLSVSIIITGTLWILNKILNFKRKNVNITDDIQLKDKDGQIYHDNESHNFSILNYLASLFPILITIFIIRCFIYEPYYIPSNSMLPTIFSGDYIIVKKFFYGISNPFTNHSIITYNHPKRGDVVIFKLPHYNKLCIKRIIGIPGDKITYDRENKVITIDQDKQNIKNNNDNNTIEIKYHHADIGDRDYQKNKNIQNDVKNVLVLQNYQNITDDYYKVYEEEINNNKHLILLSNKKSDQTENYFQQKNQPLNTWVVPKKSYFVIGDNRDDSIDSRQWGFIPEKNIIGQAGYIIMNISVQKYHLPTGINFNRIGKIH